MRIYQFPQSSYTTICVLDSFQDMFIIFISILQHLQTAIANSSLQQTVKAFNSNSELRDYLESGKFAFCQYHYLTSLLDKQLLMLQMLLTMQNANRIASLHQFAIACSSLFWTPQKNNYQCLRRYKRCHRLFVSLPRLVLLQFVC